VTGGVACEIETLMQFDTGLPGGCYRAESPNCTQLSGFLGRLGVSAVCCSSVRSTLSLRAAQHDTLAECGGQIHAESPTIVHAPSGPKLKINRTCAFAHIRQCLLRWLREAIVTAFASLAQARPHKVSNTTITTESAHWVR
jgi:hypothetical protein